MRLFPRPSLPRVRGQVVCGHLPWRLESFVCGSLLSPFLSTLLPLLFYSPPCCFFLWLLPLLFGVVWVLFFTLSLLLFSRIFFPPSHQKVNELVELPLHYVCFVSALWERSASLVHADLQGGAFETDNWRWCVHSAFSSTFVEQALFTLFVDTTGSFFPLSFPRFRLIGCFALC